MKRKQEKQERAPPLAKVLFTVDEACFLTGKGRTSIYEALASGQLHGLKDGKNTRITAEALRAYVEFAQALEVAQSRDARRGLGVNGVRQKRRGPRLNQRATLGKRLSFPARAVL